MDTLRAECPSCKCPDQHCGTGCGFCGHLVPMPAGATASDGTMRTEEVFGYRGWRIRWQDGLPYLESPVFPGLCTWEPGKWMVAECRTHGHHGGLTAAQRDAEAANPHYHGPDAVTADGLPDKTRWSPVKDCGGGGHGCGFYAGRTREHLIQLGYGKYTEAHPSVIGKVQMAGKIIPATNGFRAQRVFPHTIYVPYELWELARDLKKVYGPGGTIVEVGATLIMPKDGEGRIKWCKKCGAKMTRSTTCPLCGNVHL